jgi:hypothetical protein
MSDPRTKASPEPATKAPLGYELVGEPTAAPPTASSQTCMGCGALMRAGAVHCSRCGRDSREGAGGLAPDRSRSPKPCPACGYNLVGLKRPICPECGASFSAKDHRRFDRDHAASVARAEWVKPAVMLGTGWAIVLINALATGGPGSTGTYLLHWAITLPVGIIAYLVCCLAGLGFDAPFRLTAWRLAGTFALVDAAAVGAAIFPNDYLAWGLPAIVAFIVFERVFDLDWPEAFAAGVVTYAARKVTILAVTGQLAALV